MQCASVGRRVRLLGSALLFVAMGIGCGNEVLQSQNVVSFDIGGQVVYQPQPAEVLSGVTVSLSTPGGAPRTTVTDSSGLWTMSQLPPGVYGIRYTRNGYEPLETELQLSAFGSNTVANPFVAVPQAGMVETQLHGAMSPFPVTLESGTTVSDGLGGNSLLYSIAGDGAISITFPYPVTPLVSSATLKDIVTNKTVMATASGATITFTKSQIDTMNAGGSPITVLNVPFFWDPITVTASGFTPIHGTPVTFSATANIHVTN